MKPVAQPRRLTRSTRDERIAGVCGGLAEYFNIDPLLVRVGFVIGALAGFGGVLLYVVLWIALPKETDVGPTRGSAGAPATQIAEERYARGEITAEEFARIRDDLRR
jgi:phage shock protein C